MEKLAASTTGFTGADIENMVNQAALRAALLGEEAVNLEHLWYATTVWMVIHYYRGFLAHNFQVKLENSGANIVPY